MRTGARPPRAGRAPGPGQTVRAVAPGPARGIRSARTAALRAVRGPLLFLAGTALLFAMVGQLPGDAATVAAGRHGSQAVDQARHSMGLDAPLPQRYWTWLVGLAHADLGDTLVTNRPVASVISTPVLSTLTVTGIVLAGLALLTLPAAVAAGSRPRTRASRAASAATLGLAAVPEFVVAIAASALLCHWFSWLPVVSQPRSGQTVWDRPIVLALPSLCLWVVCSASLFRRASSLVAAHAQAPYVVEAELAGISRPRVLMSHLLPSAAPGIAQLFAQIVPYVLGGSVVIETVTTFPGMGYALVRAVEAREAPTVMAIGALLTAATVVAFAVADLVGRRGRRAGAVM